MFGFFSALFGGKGVNCLFLLIVFSFCLVLGGFFFGDTCMQFLEICFISLLEFAGVNDKQKHKKNNKTDLLNEKNT